MSVARFWPLLSVLSCAVQTAPAPPPPTAPASPSATAAAAEPTAPSASAPTPAPATPEPPEQELLEFERALGEAAHSIGFGKGKSVAVLGKEAWIDRGQGFTKLPPLGRATERVSIYFGRDDQPRAMGFEQAEGARRAVYLRFRGGAWQNGASEIGRLGGGAPGALFGVLGYADPEVVCKESEQCIIKRLTGWTTIPVFAPLASVVLCGEQAWALSQSQVWKLGAKSFEPFGAQPSFRAASALWAHTDTDVWVAEQATSSLHHHDGKAWTRHSSPIAGPRGLWASGKGELYVAGDGGLARHDGSSWTRVKGAPKNVVAIAGRGAEDLWLAASSGVFHARAR